MGNDMVDLATWAMETTLRGGALACRVTLRSERFVEVSYRSRKPECIREATQRRVGVSVYVDGRYTEQGTSDLRREPLAAFLSEAVRTTRLLEPDPYRSLPDPTLYGDRPRADLGNLDPSYEGLTPEKRREDTRAMEEACLERGGDRMVSVTAAHRDTRIDTVQVASNGFEGRATWTAMDRFVEATVQDEGERRPNGYHWVRAPLLNRLPTPESVGREAAERTLDLLGARKIPTRTLPLIVENRVVPRLLWGLVDAMSGRPVQQERSYLAASQGRGIASGRLTLWDDPLLPGGVSSRAFDDDGISSRRRLMIDAGVLRDFYVDWYYSRKLGVDPTTGGPSNVIIPAGERPVDRILRDLGEAVLVTDFIGGSSNTATGDLSLGIMGKLFRHGEPVAGVAEMNIAANHRDLWPRLREVADDPWPWSEWRTPSLVFSDVVISGA